jgi:hypothetical protein
MSKATKAFFEQLNEGKEPGLLESIREAAASLKDIGGQLWDASKPMFDHGRTELAAALFSGHGHVMYMHEQKSKEQGQDQVQTAEPVQLKEVDGREM